MSAEDLMREQGVAPGTQGDHPAAYLDMVGEKALQMKFGNNYDFFENKWYDVQKEKGKALVE